jgi:hypothetical protein
MRMAASNTISRNTPINGHRGVNLPLKTTKIEFNLIKQKFEKKRKKKVYPMEN